MSSEVFTKSLEIAQENHIPSINFFGGEPLLNPQFFPMLRTALENGFSVIVATNCRPLAKRAVFNRFLTVTKPHKESIVIVTANDRFHLEFFDPADIILRLRTEGYQLVVNDYANQTVALTEHNYQKEELQHLNTAFSCCNASPTDYVGVLPDGGWTLCPASLEPFGNVFTDSLDEIEEFKRGLSMRFNGGCTECLKDFKRFRRKFDAQNP